MCIWCSLKACPVVGAIDVAQEPAREKRGRDDPAAAQPSIFTTGTTGALPRLSSFIITTPCSLTDIRTRCTTASGFDNLDLRLCLLHTSLLHRDKRTAEASLSAARQHLRPHYHKEDKKHTGRTCLGGIRRAEEPGLHAQRRLLVLGAQEKNKGSVRSLASQKATTCCPRAIVAEGRSATFLHVLCICAPPSDSSA